MKKRSRESGATVVETAMFIPILVLFIVGMVQIGKITYLYYTLKKTLYSLAMTLSAQQSVDFCGDSNGVIASTVNLALTGTLDGSGNSLIPGLTATQISVQTECFDPVLQTVGACTSNTCDPVAGGPPPDFVVVSISGGYIIQPHIPYLTLDPFPLSPQVRVPFGGT